MTNLEELIAEARRRRDARRDAGEDFENEEAPLYENEETPEDLEETENEEAPKTVGKKKRTAAKLSITLDRNAEALTEALYKLTAAINAITPRPAERNVQQADPPAVKIGVTVSINAAALVDGLTDGVRAMTGGQREGQLSKALRDLLKDFNAPRLSAIQKGDAKRFLTMLDRRLEGTVQAALVLEDMPQPATDPILVPSSRPVEDEPKTTTTVDALEPETEEPQERELSDDEAELLIESCREYAAKTSPENRPKLIKVMNRYGARGWKDIPRDKLADAVIAVRDIYNLTA